MTFSHFQFQASAVPTRVSTAAFASRRALTRTDASASTTDLSERVVRWIPTLVLATPVSTVVSTRNVSQFSTFGDKLVTGGNGL